MQVTINELETAYKKSRLPSLGYTFQSAIDCDALKTCLVRIATNMQNKAATTPAKQYWFNQI